MLARAGNLEDEARLVYSVELALHETCVNIIQHAYRDRPGRIQVALTLRHDPPQLIVDVRDSGSSFDLSAVNAPDLEQVQTHGYGLFLMAELMDEISYQQEAGGNHWRLVKNLA
jgi:serine/threonine-protein kinase RsbW